MGTLLIPQRQLSRQLGVLIDTRFDLQRAAYQLVFREVVDYRRTTLDRKSTRLNSSHQIISYAAFCSKKNMRRNCTSFTEAGLEVTRRLSLLICTVYGNAVVCLGSNFSMRSTTMTMFAPPSLWRFRTT